MKQLSLYTFLIILFASQALYAQNNMQAKREQVKAQKAAFITSKLNLDATAAQKFWPIYNEYEAQREEISERKRELMQKLTENSGQLSEVDYDKLGNEYIDLKIKETELEKIYHYKFKEAITPSQILKLYQAENQFKQFLIKQIRESQGNQPKRRD